MAMFNSFLYVYHENSYENSILCRKSPVFLAPTRRLGQACALHRLHPALAAAQQCRGLGQRTPGRAAGASGGREGRGGREIYHRDV